MGRKAEEGRVWRRGARRAVEGRAADEARGMRRRSRGGWIGGGKKKRIGQGLSMKYIQLSNCYYYYYYYYYYHCEYYYYYYSYYEIEDYLSGCWVDWKKQMLEWKQCEEEMR